MHIWIDATNPSSRLRIFGMTLLERQLRALLEASLEPAEVYVQLAPETTNLPSLLPTSLVQELPLQWGHVSRTIAEYRTSLPGDTCDTPLLVLEASAVIDSRLLHHLAELPGSWVARGEIGAEQTAVLRLEGDPAFLDVIDTPASSLLELAQKSLQQQSVRELPLTDVPSYIRKLRRDLPVYLFRIVDPASRDNAFCSGLTIKAQPTSLPNMSTLP